MAEAFLGLPHEDRLEALRVAADRSGRPPHLLEKDVWVVWALEALSTSPFAGDLVFKGGTSLSKAYGVIQRFSEDVDLTYSIRALIPDLVGDREDALPDNKAQQRRWTKYAKDRLPKWVAEQVRPHLERAHLSHRPNPSDAGGADVLGESNRDARLLPPRTSSR